MPSLKKGLNPRILTWQRLLTISLCMILISLALGKQETLNRQDQINRLLDAQRSKRAPNGGAGNDETSLDNSDLEGSAESSTEEPKAKEDKKSEVSLSAILGICLLVCTIIYCIGIGYKIFKICKGTYVEEEPVFLKYK